MIETMNNMKGGATRVEHDGSEFARSHIKKHNAWVSQGRALIKAGVPALERLMEIAESNASGQARYVGSFLLSLYNGPRFPMPMTDLRGLDAAIMDDCLATLEMDMKACQQEVHRYFTNGGERFEALAKVFKDEDYA